jgi:general secretion pathway protein G
MEYGIRNILRQRVSRPLGDERGFTLTEMLIVIALIAMISTFVVSNIMGKYQRAKVDATKITMKQLGVILDDFKRDCGFYPTTDQGLDALVNKPTGGRECKRYDPSGYMGKQGGGGGGKVPRDGFDQEFGYESDGSKYVLKSLGADNKEGGEGVDKDITSDELD